MSNIIQTGHVERCTVQRNDGLKDLAGGYACFNV